MTFPRPFGGRSLTTSAFWQNFAGLSSTDQVQAHAAHKQWLANPRQPGLQFKEIHSRRPIYSVRVNVNVRAVGLMDEGDMVWFWIGPHDEYDELLKQL